MRVSRADIKTDGGRESTMKMYTHMRRKAMSDKEAINAIADICEKTWEFDNIPLQVHLFDRGIVGRNDWPVICADEIAALDPIIKDCIVKGVRIALAANSWSTAQKDVRASLASDRRDIFFLVLFSPSGRRIAARWEIENRKLLPRTITDDVSMRHDEEVAQSN